MNELLKKIILFSIALIGLLLFCIGILEAFTIAAKPDNIKEVENFNKNYWSYIITSINGLLTINLGVLLGVDIVIKSFSKKSFLKFENMQLIAAWLFLIILLITFLIWAMKYSFTEGTSIPNVIPQLSKTFFALILAILGFILAKKPG